MPLSGTNQYTVSGQFFYALHPRPSQSTSYATAMPYDLRCGSPWGHDLSLVTVETSKRSGSTHPVSDQAFETRTVLPVNATQSV